MDFIKESLTTTLGRIMRYIGATGYLCKTGVDEYKLTNFSKAPALPVIADGYPCMQVLFFHCCVLHARKIAKMLFQSLELSATLLRFPLLSEEEQLSGAHESGRWHIPIRT